jgi:pyridoxamine 5'-phosphate oxidase
VLSKNFSLKILLIFKRIIMNLSEIRNEYRLKLLEIDSVDPNPIVQLECWLNEASNAHCPEHMAMTLASSSTDGQPSCRIVLLKNLTHEGLFFFSNYKSRKGKELLVNPKAATSFFWPDIERQVRIEGVVSKATPDVSDSYFRSRPLGSQISATVSPQSSDIDDRHSLEKEWNKIFLDWSGRELERPDFWGGFQLKPTRFEFWQGRPHRLHDRIVYKKQPEGWQIKRLAP